MKREWTFRFRHAAAQILFGAMVLALLTLVCVRLGLGVATTAFVYLVAIVLLSLRESFISSATLSLIAVACLQYFFAVPFFDFRADLSQDLAAVIAFLLTSLIVTRLVRRAHEVREAALQAEARATQAERELRLAVDTVPALVWSTRPDGSLDFINQRWEEIGLSLDDLRDSEWTAVIHPDEREGVVDKWRRAVETGTPYENLERVRLADGEYRWVLSRARPLRDEFGKIIKWYGVDTDIEDRIRVEVALRQSERYLAEAQRLSLTGSFGWNASTGEMFWSEETFRIFGYERSRSITVDMILQRTHPEDRARVQQTLSRASSDGNDFDHEYRLLMPDGSIKHVHVVAHAANDESGSVEFVGAVRDVTTSKQFEGKLRQSEAYLHEAQRLGHIGSWAHDVSSGVLHASPELLRIFGRDPDKEKPTRELLRGSVHPDDRRFIRQLACEARRKKADFEFDHRIVLPDGSIRHVHSVAHPVLDESGSLAEYIGTIMDVTERKQAEEALRQAQAEVAHATRVTTLGELTATIAHEVNQPLAGVVSSGNACLRWLAGQPPNIENARQSVDRIIRDANRASEVVGRVRSLAKKTAPEKMWLNINETVLETLGLTRMEAAQNRASLMTQFSDDLPLVWADRIQVQQVILNLIINAIEAVSAAGNAQRDVFVTTAKDESNGVLLTIRDTGTGVDPAKFEHIFGAFYTTKREGMGMGLAVSRSIIEAHGGRLWATPNEPRGAVFQFKLPAGREEAS